VKNISDLMSLGIVPMIPDNEHAGRMQGRKRTGPSVREGFTYESETDSFICPVGERLHFHGTINEKASARSSAKTRNVYRNPSACRACTGREGCCGKKFPYKVIKITGNAKETNVYLRRFESEEGRQKYQFRRSIEKIFGHIKGNLRFRQFLCRGCAKVNAEWSLLSTAHNVLRIYLRQARQIT